MKGPYDIIRDVWRGACACGKWLVIMPSYTKEKPLVCKGMCHSTDGCGRTYYVIEEADDLKLVQEEPNGR